jgi:broad specificity phosphatase PhoE
VSRWSRIGNSAVADIWLVRHGEAAAGFGEDVDPGLSPLGHEQAHAAERLLTPVVPASASLLSSPKRRALETGAPLARLRQQQLIIDPRFIELPSPGALDERHVWIQAVLQANWSELPHAVSAWQSRIFDALAECRGPTVIFTHFLVINSVASKISGDDTVLQCMPSNGSVHHLSVSGDQWAWVSRGEMLESIVN